MQTATLARSISQADQTAGSDSKGSSRPDHSILQGVILARIGVADGATRSDLGKDIRPLVACWLNAADWRKVMLAALAALKDDGLIVEQSNRLQTSAAGQEAVRRFLKVKGTLPTKWSVVTAHHLVPRALGLESKPARFRKSLERPDILRAMILHKAYDLKLKGTPTPARVRAALAIKALERAFGNRISSELGRVPGAGMSAKASRLLAGRLSATGRDFGTDSRLIGALAAEVLGIKRSDASALQQALIRLVLCGKVLDGQWATERTARTGSAIRNGPANEKGKEKKSARTKKSVEGSNVPKRSGSAITVTKPDLDGFVKEVHRQTEICAQGWSGDRKAFISHVSQAIRNSCPQWDLSEIEFKCMLLEAHHAGKVLLAFADLKDARNIEDVQKSAVSYKGMIWHYIRVTE